MTAIFSFETQLNGVVPTKVRSQTLRMDTEDGWAVQLKRYEKKVFNQTAQFILTPTQRTDFVDTWYPANGSGVFDYTEPHSGATVQGRIIGGDYSITPMNHQHGRYLLEFQVEYLA